MPTKRNKIETYLTDEETERLDALVGQLKLKRSEFLRNLAMGYPMPSPGDFVAWQSIRDLLKVNADQARLGNLFKLALDVGDKDFSPAMIANLETLMGEMRGTQEELKNGVRDIRALLDAGKV